MVLRSPLRVLNFVSQNAHAALSRQSVGSLNSPAYKIVPSMSMPSYSSKPKPDHIEDSASSTSMRKNYGCRSLDYSPNSQTENTNQSVHDRLEEKIKHNDSISVPEIPYRSGFNKGDSSFVMEDREAYTSISSVPEIPYRNRLNKRDSSFVMEDGEAYSSFNVGMDGLPIVCNSKGWRPLSQSERKRLWDNQQVGRGPNYTSKDSCQCKSMEGYYTKLLAENGHSNPLLLRNFAHFLHEVEGDYKRAKKYYERAILANPGDGEVHSQYAKLLWDAYDDKERAEIYLERAVQAAPDDWHVLGSYASFLWDTEEVVEDYNL